MLFLNSIFILWTLEAREADKLIINFMSRCPFSSLSENVQYLGLPESTISKWDLKTSLDSIETASTYQTLFTLHSNVCAQTELHWMLFIKHGNIKLFDHLFVHTCTVRTHLPGWWLKWKVPLWGFCGNIGLVSFDNIHGFSYSRKDFITWGGDVVQKVFWLFPKVEELGLERKN